MAESLITPDWPVLAGVRAAFTLRTGGVSRAPFDSLNVGQHVGDDSRAVDENRRRIAHLLELPAEPAWLEQLHGTAVADLDRAASARRADAAVTHSPGRICAVQVADCLPVLLAARNGAAVAAAHCGWRGLASGVLEATVRALGVAPGALCAWLGPAIGPAAFEVGEEVRAAFLAEDERAALLFRQIRAAAGNATFLRSRGSAWRCSGCRGCLAAGSVRTATRCGFSPSGATVVAGGWRRSCGLRVRAAWAADLDRRATIIRAPAERSRRA